jgi:UPF0755 protein
VPRPSRLRRAGLTAGAALVIAAGAAAAVALTLSPVDRSAPPRLVDIPRGATSESIGELLYASGLVRSARAFAIAARLKGVSGSLQEGEYRLSPALPLLDILEILARGEVVLRRVTIPEGFTAAEIVDALGAAGVGTREGLHDLVTRGGSRFGYPFLRGSPGGSLEGYLFPDTYLIPRRLADRDIVDLFLKHFSAVVVPRWQAAAPERSLHDLITMASLIEREARVPSERPIIASVLYNRLARGMRLEVDATVLYALGGHKDVVTFDDLAVDSPYNTYRYAGLPPGPIANPGLAAISAALKPAQTSYLFYVARADGSHVFSRTFSEHLIAIRKYRGR